LSFFAADNFYVCRDRKLNFLMENVSVFRVSYNYNVVFVKIGLDFTPRWCLSDDDKSNQREVFRAQVCVALCS